MALFRLRQRQSGLVTILQMRQIDPVGDAAAKPEIRTPHGGLYDPKRPASVALELERNRSGQVQAFEKALRRFEHGVVLHRLCHRGVSNWPCAQLASIEACDHASPVQIQRAERQSTVAAAYPVLDQDRKISWEFQRNTLEIGPGAQQPYFERPQRSHRLRDDRKAE